MKQELFMQIRFELKWNVFCYKYIWTYIISVDISIEKGLDFFYYNM